MPARVCGFCLGVVLPGDDHPCPTTGEVIGPDGTDFDYPIDEDVLHERVLPGWIDRIAYVAADDAIEVDLSPGGYAFRCNVTREQLEATIDAFTRVLDRARAMDRTIDVPSRERRSRRS